MSEAADVRGLWESLRRRKLVQWVLAYAATAWLALQVLALAASAFEWPVGVLRIATLVAVVGFVLALVLAWYHGERGAQRISGPELLILAAVLGTGGLLLWRATPGERGSEPLSGGDSVAGANGVRPESDSDPLSAPAEASIAVLPLANLSGDADQEYFSDGMSEELLNVLAKVPGLRVAARTSSFQFKGRNLDIQDIARQLNVATVLEGSLRKSGNRVRITAQLIDARSGYHLWSETYDRELDDIFAVQDDIAAQIVGALRGKLGLAAAAPSGAAQAASPEAYDAYLLGRELLLQRTRTSVAQGLAALQRATTLDPGYAPAWAQLASAYYLSRRGTSTYGDMGQAESKQLATAALAQTRRLDPDLDDAYAVEGVMKQFFDNDLAGALAAHEQAIARNPGNVQALYWRAELLPRFGRYRDALEQELALARIDPLFDLNNFATARDLTVSDSEAEAAAFIERIRSPVWKHAALAIGAAREGQWQEAAFHHVATVGHEPGDTRLRAILGRDLLMLGLYDDAKPLHGAVDGGDEVEAVRGDWVAAVEIFGTTEASRGRNYWFFRQGQNLFRAGRSAEALAQFDACWASVWPFGVADDPAYYSPRRPWYALLLRDAGRADEARSVMDVNRADIAAARRDGFRAPIFDLMAAEIAVWEGRHDEALGLLPRGLIAEPFLSSIESDPMFEPLRAMPAFAAAVASERERRAGLRERFLRDACAAPANAVWRPLPASCASVVGAASAATGAAVGRSAGRG